MYNAQYRYIVNSRHGNKVFMRKCEVYSFDVGTKGSSTLRKKVASHIV
jgi:hypothetical protein